MRIRRLSDRPDMVPLVARWHHAAFGALNPSRTLEQRLAWLEGSLCGNDLPLTLLACTAEGVPAGCASLTAGTLTHPHLTPWLGLVYVRPELRRAGVGSALALRAAAECARSGHARLHLFTPHHERLYRRLGWATFERTEVNAVPVAVMEKCVRWT
jgi:GNAT superfamily N-acetyltransferase